MAEERHQQSETQIQSLYQQGLALKASGNQVEALKRFDEAQ